MHRALVSLALTTALGACTVDDAGEGIFITKNVVPGEGCTFAATEAEPFLPHGTWSLLSPSGYRFHPQMKSRITAVEGQEEQRTIIVQGARIDLAFADETLFDAGELTQLQSAGVTKFESRFSAPIAPNGGITDGGFDLITRDLIDAILAKRPDLTGASPPTFRTEILATAVVFGDMSGSEVKSQPFQFPVTLCNDCVVNVVGTCPLPAETTVSPGNPCNPFQDGVADCCVGASGVVCPAPVATM